MIGQTLAHYKILEKIGSGGMGEVFLAEDTKLDRKVAVKVLPPELAASEERRARFTREAKAIAALNRPNIVTVHSVEQAGDVHFITMELVKGKTLTELLSSSGLSLAKFFEIAIPLADAVAAAHQEGITHRDLKPDNVMQGDDGRIKVLDWARETPERNWLDRQRPPHTADDPGRSDSWNRRLHVPRASRGKASQYADRHFLARYRFLRDADREPTLPGRDLGGGSVLHY